MQVVSLSICPSIPLNSGISVLQKLAEDPVRAAAIRRLQLLLPSTSTTSPEKEKFGPIVSLLSGVEEFHLGNVDLSSWKLPPTAHTFYLYMVSQVDKMIVNQPNLRHLSLSDCDISDEGLSHLSKLCSTGQLYELHITGCTKLSDEGIINLTQSMAHSGIRKLTLSHMASVGSSAVEQIALSSPSIYALSLSNSHSLTNAGVQALSYITNLRELSLDSVYSLSNLEFIYSLDKLESLNVADCRGITDTALAPLNKMKNLTKISVSRCKLLTDEGMKIISSIPLLQHVNISCCPFITDKGLEEFIMLRYLCVLNASRCVSLTGKSITLIIQEIPSLYKIYLFGCPNINIDVSVGSNLEVLI